MSNYTLADIYEIIHNSAIHKVGVNSVYDTEPYSVWNSSEIKYGSVCIFIDTLTSTIHSRQYNINLYYGDRLTETDDNLFQVQNTAIEVITDIIKDLEGIEGIDIVEQSTINLFKQKFMDRVGGAYTTISLWCGYDSCNQLDK